MSAVAAGAWTQPYVGEPRKFRFSLVDDDQLRALFDRLLYWNRRYVLLLGDVTRNDEEAL